jgi:hypothetical protein
MQVAVMETTMAAQYSQQGKTPLAQLSVITVLALTEQVVLIIHLIPEILEL